MKNSIINRSQVLILAHQIRRNDTTISFSDAQKQAWKLTKATAIKTALQAGTVQFNYINEQGEVRNATGTLNNELFNYEYKTQNGGQQAQVVFTGTVKYYDLDKKGFRSFRVDRVNKIVSVQTISNK